MVYDRLSRVAHILKRKRLKQEVKLTSHVRPMTPESIVFSIDCRETFFKVIQIIRIIA